MSEGINSHLSEDMKERAILRVTEALEDLGFDLEDENFKDTPRRFVGYLTEFLQPFDPVQILRVDFNHEHVEAGYKGMIVQSNIPYRAVCPHHLLPIVGVCDLGYIPSGRLAGLSKLTRLVAAVGHEMPRMQETNTDILADILSKHLDTKGVIVVVSATHGCMEGRGVKVHNVPTTTSTVRGLFRDVPAARAEFFELLRIGKSGT